MKRIANYLIALAVAAFTFTSCADVPSPFGDIVKPDSGDVVVIEPSGTGTEADPYFPTMPKALPTSSPSIVLPA